MTDAHFLESEHDRILSPKTLDGGMFEGLYLDSDVKLRIITNRKGRAMSAVMEEDIYTAEQVRQILGLRNVRTVHRLIKRGELNAFTVGRDYRIRASALREFIEKRPKKRGPEQPEDPGLRRAS